MRCRKLSDERVWAGVYLMLLSRELHHIAPSLEGLEWQAPRVHVGGDAPSFSFFGRNLAPSAAFCPLLEKQGYPTAVYARVPTTAGGTVTSS